MRSGSSDGIWQNPFHENSHEYRALGRAIINAGGNRDLAIKKVCRLYVVPHFDRLPVSVWTATLVLLSRQ